MNSFLHRFGLPINASVHGSSIDHMNEIVHWFMLLLFIGWGLFFIYCLVRFRRSKQPIANYTGVQSHATNYVEAGVAIFEAVLLIGFAFPKACEPNKITNFTLLKSGISLNSFINKFISFFI